MNGICGECGEQNAPGSQFCASCRAYLGWDATTQHPASPTTGPPTPITGPASPVTPPRRSPDDPTQGRFRLSVPGRAVSVAATGEPAVLTVLVANTSSIVDGYAVLATSVPGWLHVESDQPRLLPGTEASLTVRLRAVAPAPVLAQQLRIGLVVRSLSQAPAYADLPLELTVPALEVPIRLRAEPRLLRIRDRAAGEFSVVAENPGNRPARLTFAGSDPELAVGFRFHPESLQVGPGASGTVRVEVTAPGPLPGEEISRQLTVTATDGGRSTETQVTLQQGHGVSALANVAVRVEPSLIRVSDADGADVQVVLDNRRGSSGLRLTLEGRDPEQAMRLSFGSAVVDLAPGQISSVPLRLDAWRPAPGQEITRPFTVTVSDGRSSVDAGGSLVQSSSRPAIESLAVRLDPSILRLSNQRRGTVGVTVDNRGGAQPVRVWLRGDDPENVVRFGFVPDVLDIPAGQLGHTRVSLDAPRPPARQEATRPFNVVASDGRTDVVASGTLIQRTGDRRPIARAVWTLLGALAMMVAPFQVWLADRGLRGVDLTPSVFSISAPLGGFEDLISLGLGLGALGLLALLGLIGARGRLTRFAAVIGALGLIALFVFLAVRGIGETPGAGALVGLAGCIAAYVGGRLVRR